MDKKEKKWENGKYTKEPHQKNQTESPISIIIVMILIVIIMF
jgi:hypothetical protein